MWLEFYFCCMVLAYILPCHWIRVLDQIGTSCCVWMDTEPSPLTGPPGTSGSSPSSFLSQVLKDQHMILLLKFCQGVTQVREVCGNSCIYMTFILLRKMWIWFELWDLWTRSNLYLLCSLPVSWEGLNKACIATGKKQLSIHLNNEVQTLYLDPRCKKP